HPLTSDLKGMLEPQFPSQNLRRGNRNRIEATFQDPVGQLLTCGAASQIDRYRDRFPCPPKAAQGHLKSEDDDGDIPDFITLVPRHHAKPRDGADSPCGAAHQLEPKGVSRPGFGSRIRSLAGSVEPQIERGKLRQAMLCVPSADRTAFQLAELIAGELGAQEAFVDPLGGRSERRKVAGYEHAVVLGRGHSLSEVPTVEKWHPTRP